MKLDFNKAVTVDSPELKDIEQIVTNRVISLNIYCPEIIIMGSDELEQFNEEIGHPPIPSGIIGTTLESGNVVIFIDTIIDNMRRSVSDTSIEMTLNDVITGAVLSAVILIVTANPDDTNLHGTCDYGIPKKTRGCRAIRRYLNLARYLMTYVTSHGYDTHDWYRGIVYRKNTPACNGKKKYSIPSVAWEKFDEMMTSILSQR